VPRSWNRTSPLCRRHRDDETIRISRQPEGPAGRKSTGRIIAGARNPSRERASATGRPEPPAPSSRYDDRRLVARRATRPGGARAHRARSRPRRGSVLVRSGKGGRRREVGMDDWGWEQLRPWLAARTALPVAPWVKRSPRRCPPRPVEALPRRGAPRAHRGDAGGAPLRAGAGARRRAGADGHPCLQQPWVKGPRG
jgi:hypothetical protein